MCVACTAGHEMIQNTSLAYLFAVIIPLLGLVDVCTWWVMPIETADNVELMCCGQ